MKASASPAPSSLLLALEGRAPLEWAAYLVWRSRMRSWPRGDGHPVLVLPGLATNDLAMAPLRDTMSALGYQVYPWDEGFNTGPSPALLASLVQRIEDIYDAHGQPVSLVGWSLGGALARGLAAACPGKVRSVIAMASPLRKGAGSNLSGVFEWLSNFSPQDDCLHRWMNRPTQVPISSIVSKGDGLVDWRSGVLPRHATRETIEVLGVSHLGMPVHPAVMWVVADRLRQDPGAWRPYQSPPGLAKSWSSPLTRAAPVKRKPA